MSEEHDAVSEKDLQSAVLEQMRWMGWRCYHTFDSRRSEPGFPDLLALRASRAMVVEFKSEKGKIRPEQIEWLDAFVDAQYEVHLVRPSTQDAFLKEVKSLGTSLDTYWRNVRQET